MIGAIAMSKCPICERPAKPREENASYPFCSPRCKTIDLGKWVNEEYRIPVESSDEDDDGALEDPKSGPAGRGPVRH